MAKINYLMKFFFNSDAKRKAENDSAEDIHRMAQDYFSADFANPSRIDCPPPELFHKLISGKQLPDENLQNHLLSCSECFNDYRANLRQNEAAEIIKKNASWRFNFILAGSLAAVLIALGSLFWFWKKDENPVLTAKNDNSGIIRNSAANAGILTSKEETNLKPSIENPPVIPENTANAPRRNQATNEKRTSPQDAEKTQLLAKNEVEIDLNNPVWRDSANASNRKNITLEAGKIRLRVRLPKENPAGAYQIFFADEFGKPLTEKKIALTKNQFLSAGFDLRKLKGNQNRICVAPADEIPDCVPIKIIPPK